MKRKIINYTILLFLSMLAINSNAQLNKSNQNDWKFNLKQAEKNYKKIINEHSDSILISYANVLFQERKYNEASFYYAKADSLGLLKSIFDKRNYIHSNKIANIKLPYIIESNYFCNNLKWNALVDLHCVNTSKEDFAPFYWGNNLFVTSSRLNIKNKHKFSYDYTEMPYLDVYLFDSNCNIIYKPKGIPANLNSDLHDGPICIAKDTSLIVITRNYNEPNEKDIHNLYLTTFIRLGKKWSKGEMIYFCSTKFSVQQPYFNDKESKLYFSSNMPGGFGGFDLYTSFWNGSEWGNPVNLGSKINSEFDEGFPSFDLENNFIFSTNHIETTGGFDLVLFNEGKKYLLPPPFNTVFDDFGITFKTKDQGSFTSNRNTMSFDDNIYKFNLNVLRRTSFTVKLVDSATNEIISSSLIEIKEENTNDNSIIDSAKTSIFNELLYNKTSYMLNINADKYVPKTISIVTNDSFPEIIIPVHKIKTDFLVEGIIINKSTKVPISQSNIIIIDLLTKDTVYNKIVDEDGKFSFSSIKNNKLYYIDVYKEGFLKNPGMLLNTLNASAETEIEKMGDYLKNIELSEIVIGKSIKIENIYFDLDKYNIRPDAAIELDKIVSLMKNNPNLIIELGSHTDCRSSFDYNMKLSNNRANLSVAYIVSNGINKKRISANGYGETMLVNDCKCEMLNENIGCTEEEHQANRRTEFKITGLLNDKNTTILNNGMGNSPKSVPLPKH